MGRLFGIRNIALAAGLLWLEATTAPRSFLLVNVLIDLVDASAFAAGGRRAQMGRSATVLGTALALTGAALSRRPMSNNAALGRVLVTGASGIVGWYRPTRAGRRCRRLQGSRSQLNCAFVISLIDIRALDLVSAFGSNQAEQTARMARTSRC